MSPLLSVIVPVYNVENFLDTCIKSIISQTYKNLEIILIDDGSTDSSGVLCDSYQKRDNRIIVIHKENGGLSDARNRGLDVASGEYITFVDSDDYIAPDFLMNLINLIISNNADISIAPLCHVKENNNLVVEFVNRESIKEYDSKSAIVASLYQKDFSCNAHSKVYKKEIFSSIRFPLGRVTEDLAIAYRLFEVSSKIVSTNKWGYYYRQREKSIMHSFNSKRLDAIEWLENMENDPLLKRSDILRAIHCRMINVSIHLALDIPYDSKYKKEHDAIWKCIKEHRKETLFNNNARLQDRGAAFLSYFGEHLLKRVWNSKFAVRRKEY